MESTLGLFAGRGKDAALVGMLHAAVNTILLGPPAWRAALGLPNPTVTDLARADAWREGDDPAALSFYGYLRDRMLNEAAIYTRHGLGAMMLENVGGPYFLRDDTPAVMIAVMRRLAAELRAAYPQKPLGIQILAFGDNLGLEIAVAEDLDFVRGESLLFQGWRPEGPTPNRGNLARFYWRREQLLAARPRPGRVPLLLVDILKKHTVFPRELADEQTWLENISFQKLEGVIVTGAHTGRPPDEAVLEQARGAVDQAAALLARLSESVCGGIPLLVGSGISADNLAMVQRHANGALVGTAFKRHAHWECALDEDRVARFMQAWRG